ncbi:MAG: response regulator transcription factor [Elusimicrobia bacterium]|nr:response regulator transcription factor [Elusimicrobiota bacterium]
MPFKLLIVEKTPDICAQMGRVSKKQEVLIVRAASFAKAYRAAARDYPDALLLVEKPGLEINAAGALVEKLAQTPRLAFIPLFCLCRRGDHAHKKTALTYHIDCLGASLDPCEVPSFIRGRVAIYQRNAVLKLGSIALDPVRRVLWSNHGTKTSRRVPPKEFELMYHLGKNSGQPDPERAIRKALRLKHSENINTIACRARQAAPLPVRRLLHIDFVPGQGWRLTVD